MPGLVQSGYEALLVDTLDDAVRWGFTGRVDDGEFLSKVTEERSKQTKGIGDNDIDALGVAVVGNELL